MIPFERAFRLLSEHEIRFVIVAILQNWRRSMDDDWGPDWHGGWKQQRDF
jgi:hypothetical protein